MLYSNNNHLAHNGPIFRNGESALHIAGQLGDSSMVQMLIQKGADLSLQDHDGNTVLHLLAVHSAWDTDNSSRFTQVKALLEEPWGSAHLLGLIVGWQATQNLNFNDSIR